MTAFVPLSIKAIAWPRRQWVERRPKVLMPKASTDLKHWRSDEKTLTCMVTHITMMGFGNELRLLVPLEKAADAVRDVWGK